MRIIVTYQDLEVFRHAKAIQLPLLGPVQDYFNQLRGDNDMLVERINELKSKYNVLANRKSEAERQLDKIGRNPSRFNLYAKRSATSTGFYRSLRSKHKRP
ncbi:hypothetical protein [Paenibacillus tuaregi]|uniref:hypothetical protein n=1 Tax=Paenibacillus tuaregi TaxID=1816681 RepID=UPI000837C919|nr:hypothetical protein [Paenibacillus tuaregi]